MEPRYVFLKEIDLDEENRFTLNLIAENTVEKIKLLSLRTYFLTSLKVIANTKTDKIKWND